MSLSLTSRPGRPLALGSNWVAAKNILPYKFTSTSFSGLTNYRVEVEVFKSSDDTSLTGGVKFSFRPDTTGLTNVDVSAIVKSYLSDDYTAPATLNDLDATASLKFYIKYQELYDGSATSVVSDSDNPIHAVYAAMQIFYANNTYGYGVNMVSYVPSTSFSDRDWLTRFRVNSVLAKLRYWTDYPWSLSFIWPDSFSSMYAIQTQYDITGNALQSDLNQLDNTGGKIGAINRLQISGLLDSAESVSLQLCSEGTNYLSTSSFADDGLTTPWLIAPYELNSKSLRSSTISPTVPNGTSVTIQIVISSGALQNIFVDLLDGSNNVVQTVSFGDKTTGTYSSAVTTSGIISKVQVRAAANNTNQTGYLDAVSIIGGSSSITIPNSSFATSASWTSVDAGSTPDWSIGGGEAIVAVSGAGGTDYLRSGSFTSIAAGTAVNGDIVHNVGAGIFGRFDVYMWNGSTREQIYTTGTIFGTGSDVTINVPTYTLTGTGFTNLEIQWVHSSGSGSVRVKDVPNWTQSTSYTIPNGNFSGLTSWTQTGSGYSWTSSGAGQALLTIPAPTFGLDYAYLGSGSTGRTKRTGLSIPAGTYNLLFNYNTGGSTTTALFEFRNGSTVVYSLSLSLSILSTYSNNITLSGSIDNIRITATHASGTTGIFAISSLSLTSIVPASTAITVDIDDPCDNAVCLFWKNSTGGDSYYTFNHSQDVSWIYNGTKKAKRMILYAENIEYVEWEAINELNSLGEVYSPNITELTTTNRYTSLREGQNVFIVAMNDNTDLKIGVIVIPRSQQIRTKDTLQRIEIEIELPEVLD